MSIHSLTALVGPYFGPLAFCDLSACVRDFALKSTED